jgi:hypothetical protein
MLRAEEERAMIDVATMKPLRVETYGTVWPSITVSVNQLDEVQRLLDRHGLSYDVEDEAISINDGPELTDIYFRRGADAGAIQAILDSAP